MRAEYHYSETSLYSAPANQMRFHHLYRMRKEATFGNVFMQRNEQRVPKLIN